MAEIKGTSETKLISQSAAVQALQKAQALQTQVLIALGSGSGLGDSHTRVQQQTLQKLGDHLRYLRENTREENTFSFLQAPRSGL